MKEKLSLIYKIIIVIVSAVGIILNLKALTPAGSLVYYTIQSNIWCFVFYLVIVILMIVKKLERNNIYYIFKGMVTMAITITMFVYYLLLSSGSSNAYVGLPLECAFVHLITPLLVIFDYIIFGQKGNLKKNYPFIWSLTLVVYVIFVIIYSSIGGTFLNGKSYPYFFMNVDKYGVGRVFVNCLVVYVFFVGAGTIVQTIDNKLGKRQNLTK